MASLSLRGIYKIFDDGTTAVDNFNLEIEDKEFIVLVGPSGCGKSTTLRMIAGLEEISKGDLFIGKNKVNGMPPKDRNIAMVFQSYALYPNKTVYKNMSFGLENHKVPKDEIDRRVQEAAQILGIEKLLSRKPRALSGGQRQRVALGRAMVRDPDVFLLDEPLSNLDAKLRTAMRTQITKLHRRLGTTFIYVTHDQTEAMTMGDRIVVMKDGIIQQVDTPQRLYDEPINTFVASFIGSPQMNFIDGKIERDTQGIYINLGPDKILMPDKYSRDRIDSYVGDEVTVGIRPENISDSELSASRKGASVLEGMTEVTELMGSEVYAYIKYSNTRLIARLKPDTKAKSDSVIRFVIDENKIHLFDKITGAAI